jgi:histidinol-phosphatase
VSQRAVEVASEAARAAGEIALKYYTGGFDVTLKADHTPVTQADQQAEQSIRRILGRAFPDHGFLGEEFGGEGRQDRRWIIDPIDGTQNFIRGIPIWATLIALEEDGEVTAGVVYNPVTREMHTAQRGGGAFLNGRPIHVSPVSALADSQLIHAGLGLVRRTPYWDGIVRLLDGTQRQRGFGDYLGYTLVAEGKAELYVELDIKPWDIAPCRLLVEEAGGRFTDFTGQPSIFSGTAVASNGRVHDAALAALRG